jgi:hypothetical protein
LGDFVERFLVEGLNAEAMESLVDDADGQG